MHNLTSGAAYGISATSIFTGILSSFTYEEWNALAVVSGIILAIITTAVNLYYRRKDDRRKEAEHAQKIKR